MIFRDLEQRLFRGKLQKCLHLFEVINQLKSQLHFFHKFKDAKPQPRRALLASGGDDLIKTIVECAINTLNGNHKLSKEEKSKLSKYKNRLRELIDPKISFKTKRKILINKRGFIVPLLISILPVVIGTLIKNC